MTDLKTAAKTLRKATGPEAIFGATADAAHVDEVFKGLARMLHPDRHAGAPLAHEAMARLNALRDQATRKLADGTWGKADKPKTSITAGHVYVDVLPLASGDICDVFTGKYGAGSEAVIKIARSSRDADLLRNEATVLRALGALDGDEARSFQRYIPTIIEDARLTIGGVIRSANIFERPEPGYTLREVVKRHGGALDARHVTWIWKRLLEGLDWIHRQGYVHAGITPDHVLIFPRNHGVKILDWSYAVKAKGTVKAISAPCRAFYPAEILAKKPAGPGADLFMVAKCMAFALGGAPAFGGGLIQACTLPEPHRFQDANEVLATLKRLARSAFGPPKFVELSM